MAGLFMVKKLLPFLVSLALLAGLIYFSDVGKIYRTILRVNLYLFLLSVGLWFISHLIKVVRWKYLLGKNSVRIGFWQAFRIFTASGFFSNITPAKAGEPLKSFILKKSDGVSVGKTMPAIFFERVFDIGSLIIVSLVAMLFLTRTVTKVQYLFGLSIITYAILIAAAVFVLISKKRTTTLASKLYRVFSFVPKVKDLNNRIGDFVDSFHGSFVTYKNKRLYFVVLCLSVSIWTIEGAILFILFTSLGFEVSLASTMFIIPVATLVSVITLLPGGIGSSEIVIVLFFSSLFGLTFADVTSVAIVTRLATFWSSTMLGAFFFSRLKYKYKL